MAVSGNLPRFREDLLAEQIEQDGKHFVDVMDDASGVMFRFYDVEYALACAMNGERDVDAIVGWAENELGFRPRPQDVRRVVETLGDLGYLDEGTSAMASSLEAGETIPTPVSAAPRDDAELVRG